MVLQFMPEKMGVLLVSGVRLGKKCLLGIPHIKEIVSGVQVYFILFSNQIFQ